MAIGPDDIRNAFEPEPTTDRVLLRAQTIKSLDLMIAKLQELRDDPDTVQTLFIGASYTCTHGDGDAVADPHMDCFAGYIGSYNNVMTVIPDIFMKSMDYARRKGDERQAWHQQQN